MNEMIIFKPKFFKIIGPLLEVILSILALIYMWIITNNKGWTVAHTKYGHEFIYYQFYTYFIAIFLMSFFIANIKKYITLKKCKIVFDKDSVQLDILKRKYLTKKQKKGLINRIKKSYYPIVNSASDSEYYNILISESIMYKDIINVDTIKNLKVKMTYSHVNDLGVLTKDNNYFIDASMYSKKNIELIRDELLKRVNNTKLDID